MKDTTKNITVDKQEFREGINALAIGEFFAKLYFVQDSITQIMESRNVNLLAVISQLRIEYNAVVDALQKEKNDRPDILKTISVTALVTIALGIIGYFVIR